MDRFTSEPRPTKRGYVYFVRYGKDGPIRISAAASPLARAEQLQAQHFETLKLLGWVEATIASERFWLNGFGDYLIRGEWFHPHPNLIREIERTIGPIEVETRRAS